MTTGKRHSKETKRKMSEKKRGLYEGDKNPMFGQKHSDESRSLMSECARGRVWITNGIVNKRLPQEEADTLISMGWRCGRAMGARTSVNYIKKIIGDEK